MQLSKQQFRDNLVKALQESLNEAEWAHIEHAEFSVNPISEYNVTYNSADDNYKRWILSNENLKNIIFDLNQVVDLLALPGSHYPLWIDIIISRNEKGYVINLNISLRIRKPTQLKNRETGHPPFKVVNSI